MLCFRNRPTPTLVVNFLQIVLLLILIIQIHFVALLIKENASGKPNTKRCSSQSLFKPWTFAAELENIVQEYSIDLVVKSVEYYKKFNSDFGNKNDFLFNSHLTRNLCKNFRSPIFIISGLNEGQSAKNILNSCPRGIIHGFEIQHGAYLTSMKNLKEYQSIYLNEMGLSNRSDYLQVSGSGEGAGIFPAEGRWRDAYQQGYVQVTPAALYVEKHHISQIQYAIIDVEGHEQEVIQGMELEYKANRFPIFQYELGGTWADSRRTGCLTQFTFAVYLQSLGYELFLIGEKNEKPYLLKTPPEFYRYSIENTEGFEQGGQKYFVQGNALAINWQYLEQSTKEYIKSLIE